MLFFGYYTTGTPYEREVITLRASLDALGLPHEFLGVASLGSWQKNTQHKAHVVLDAMKRHDGERLCYIDVDAIVLKRPELLWTLDCDVAAVRFNGNELLSGTVLWHSSATTVDLVEHWIALNREYPETLPDGREAWDQRTLDMAIRHSPHVRFVELPPEYAYIVELSQRVYPDVAPVILHTRGALRLRKAVDK